MALQSMNVFHLKRLAEKLKLVVALWTAVSPLEYRARYR